MLVEQEKSKKSVPAHTTVGLQWMPRIVVDL